jgi:lipopolysaccharide export LptBFGC system permease protein LptF
MDRYEIHFVWKLMPPHSLTALILASLSFRTRIPSLSS